MKIGVLGSGSSGNCSVITLGSNSVLVDAGFSCKQIISRLEAMHVEPDSIQGILITHEHIDHVRGAGVFARKFQIPLFGSAATMDRSRNIVGNVPEILIIEPGEIFELAGLTVQPFSVSHDAADPMAYTLTSPSGISTGICTDLGYVTHLVRERLKACNALILEMNHDPNMLLAGRYPWNLKQRIRSRIGHLSNEDAAEFIREIWHENLLMLILAHLSQENNLPHLAKIVAQNALAAAGGESTTMLEVASQHEHLGLMDLETLMGEHLRKELADDRAIQPS